MKKFTQLVILLIAVVLAHTAAAQMQALPAITGAPTVYSPDLLDWPRDFEAWSPDLTEPTSNRIYDLHMQVRNCDAFDLVLSTSGNYHMALTAFWYEHFLPLGQVQNWYFSTSPPIGPEQAQNQALSFGNVGLACPPHLAVGPRSVMQQLDSSCLLSGEPLPLFTNRGNVLLVKKGNPQNIQTIWDLGRPGIRLATSNPYTEPGSFGNYASSIYNIALRDGDEARAQALFEAVFGRSTAKWVSGERIHHREVPHLLYKNQADVSMVFYHLARYFVACFPDEFEIVPLGGSVESPEPLPGNKVARLYIARINTPLSSRQQAAREAFLAAIKAGKLDSYLLKNHIDPAR